jgi:DNA-binding LacI/PurR family transcriptional regulator
MAEVRERAPTLSDVAARTGFSPQTVHRALHARHKVSPPTRAKILQAVEEMGYRPNRIARNLATAKSSILGIVSLGTYFYGPSQTILSIDEAAKTHGLNVMLSSVSSASPENIRRAVAEISEYSPAGIILLSPIRLTDSLFRSDHNTLPLIVVGECAPFQASGTIDHDYVGATKQAVQFLIHQGHRKIACLTGPPDWTPTSLRYRGWRDALVENGLVHGPCVQGDWSPRSGYDAACSLLKTRQGTFTALVAQNDLMAFGVLHAFHEHGIRVPQDVSVIGCDDMTESSFTMPPLTTIKQDFAAIGLAAVNNLLAAAAKEEYNKSILLECPLVVRESTASPFKGAGSKACRTPGLKGSALPVRS